MIVTPRICSSSSCVYKVQVEAYTVALSKNRIITTDSTNLSFGCIAPLHGEKVETQIRII